MHNVYNISNLLSFSTNCGQFPVHISFSTGYYWLMPNWIKWKTLSLLNQNPFHCVIMRLTRANFMYKYIMWSFMLVMFVLSAHVLILCNWTQLMQWKKYEKSFWISHFFIGFDQSTRLSSLHYKCNTLRYICVNHTKHSIFTEDQLECPNE